MNTAFENKQILNSNPIYMTFTVIINIKILNKHQDLTFLETIWFNLIFSNEFLSTTGFATIWYSVITIRVFEYYSKISNGPNTEYE